MRKIAGNVEEGKEREIHPRAKMEAKSKESDNDYSYEYLTNATFPTIRKEEATVGTILSPKKQPSIDLNSKYECKEEIVSSDSGASARGNGVIDDKLCRICDVKFRYYAHYEKHFNDDHPNKIPYDCRYCHFRTTKRNYLLSHIRKRHSVEEIPSRHVRRNKLIECEECHTEHRGVNKFQIHVTSQHKGMKLIKCGLCNARFSWYPNLAKHEMEKHGMRDGEFQCGFCKNYFAKSDDLEIHVKKCADRQAEKKMDTNNNQGSEKEEKYGNVCCECGEKFVRFSHLKNHFKSSHPGIRGFLACKVCGKRFSAVQNLEKHADKYHVDERERAKGHHRWRRNFRCPYCGDEFQGLVVYEKHGILVHGKNWKLFFCEECDVGFKRKFALKKHVLGVHKGSAITKPLL